MDKEKAEKILEQFCTISSDSSYRKADALENITELVPGLLDFCDNVEEFCKDIGKRVIRLENIIATPGSLTELESEQYNEIERLKTEIEAKRQHIKNLCEVIANVTVKSREVKDKSEELYYGVLNGNLRDEKGHMK